MSVITEIPWTDEQLEILNYWSGGLAVIAGAGCGKTTTLVGKCRALLERDPTARFLAVSFTEKSTQDLQEKLLEGLGSEVYRRQSVVTIHGLCGQMIREFPAAAGIDGEERILSEDESRVLWERTVEALWFDPLPENVEAAFLGLLERENRESIESLLLRGRALSSFGFLNEWPEFARDPGLGNLKTVAGWVLRKFELAKKRQGVLDFDDLERAADRALSNSEVRTQLHRRWNWVFIDEFQDTNVVQAALMKRVAHPNWKNAVVVGDPKQSIYRFRDADVSVFEEICGEMSRILPLSLNRRCRPAILELTNALCQPLFTHLDKVYVPIQPARESLGQSTFHWKVNSPEEFAKRLVELQKSGQNIGDVALLLRRIRGSEDWIRAIVQAQIPVVVGGSGFFWSDPRVIEMEAYLRWFYDEHDTHSAAVFLRAPWMRISDAELDQWFVARSSNEAILDGFLKSGHPLSQVLDRGRREGLRPSQALELLWTDPRIETELAVTGLSLWHFLEKASASGMTATRVLQEIRHAIESGRKEKEMPPPSGNGLLRVMTIHASKGLEFETVILLDFTSSPRAKRMPLLYWNRHEGPFLGVRKGDGARDSGNVAEASWREREIRETLAESQRVLYVAMTRAREKLFLVMPTEPKMVKDGKDPLLEDYWWGWWNHLQLEVPEWQGADRNPSADDPNSPERHLPEVNHSESLSHSFDVEWVRNRHSVSEWKVLGTCERNYLWKLFYPKVALPKRLDLDQVTKKGAELGTWIHERLEKKQLEWDEESPEGTREILDHLRNWVATRPIFFEPETMGGQAWDEFQFEIPVGNGGVLVGAIDRVVHVSGRWILVDYKWSNQRVVDPSWEQAYRLQLEVYSWALGQMIGDHQGSISDLEVFLIRIHPGGIEEKKVMIHSSTNSQIQEWVTKSKDVITRWKKEQISIPSPSAECVRCEFQKKCLGNF